MYNNDNGELCNIYFYDFLLVLFYEINRQTFLKMLSLQCVTL